MKSRSLFFVPLLLVLALLLPACSQSSPGMRDGYYTAEAAAFDAYGWKEYITIYVSDNKIVTVEYDAQNASGFIKSWDMEYARNMYASDGIHPNEYMRGYIVALLNWQNPDEVDAISGATDSHASFRLLAEAAIAQAMAGDEHVALVELSAAKGGGAEK